MMAMGRHPMVDPSRQMMQPQEGIPRSGLSSRDFFKLTFGHGHLVPVFLQEVLPADSIRVNMSALVRLAAPIVPMMDNIQLESWFFFVPYRLLWIHWEQFIAGPKGPTDTATYLVPQIPVVNADVAPGSLSDFFGLTVNGSANTINVSALPFRAYALIWQEWFRDQAIQAELSIPTGDGPDAMASYGLFTVSKKHDYFSSSRPWPQAAGNAQETGNIGPLTPGGRFTFGDKTFGIGAPVSGIGIVSGGTTAVPGGTFKESGSRGTLTYANAFATNTAQPWIKATGVDLFPDVKVLVNDLRMAVVMQTVLEKQARVGGRYTEFLRGVFRVNPPDSRLQRPEYLGGGRTMVTVNPVAQTSASAVNGASFSAATRLGQLAATAYVAATDHGFSASFVEHGIVIGLMATRTELTYQQGVERFWWRKSQFDFYRPELGHLPEQPVLSKEIYCDGSAADNNVWGYQERWAEYRTRLSRTAGYMRSTVATPIDMWHTAEKFAGRPTLGTSYITEDAGGVARVLQASAPYSAQYMGDVMFDTHFQRAMPMFSVPGFGSHL